MALALYRKYRPATFADVVGQEHVTEPLRQALASGRINHAYLFSGPRGCGKTSSARILARSLNCVTGPTPTPCGECDSCVALAPDGPGSLDVIEIDAASHGGVDDARDLRERAFYAPVSSRYKVYIIDEAHMVSSQGFNALLKLVEEPPEFLVFVFATTEPDKVLPTIRSRTHHYPFRLIPPGTLRGLLERICADEGVVVEPAVLPLVVRGGNGSARDSLSVLDQLIAGAAAEGVSYRHAVALLGVTDSALLDEMVDALAAGDGAAAFQTVDRVVEAGHDPRRFAGDLLERLRDLLVLDAVPDAVGKGLLDAPADQLDRMVEAARRLGPATLSRLADIVHGGLVEMRGTTSPRLLLELVCARMLLPSAGADPAALLQRLERLERRSAITAAVPAAERAPKAGEVRQRPVQPPSTVPAAAPDAAPSAAVSAAPSAAPSAVPLPPTAQPAQPAQPAQEGGFDGAAVRRVWPEVLDVVKAQSQRTRALLAHATVSAVDGSELVLTLATAALARLLADESNLSRVRSALRDVIGVDWQVRVRVEDGADGSPLGSPAAPSAAALPASAADPRDEISPEDDEPVGPPERRDPDELALSLLRSGLGARSIDPGGAQ
ncbi:MAG TPA: DNA polymerase III subunit gamma and tau [Mycobacteriales bacterium]|nr:DNA polymerase III subunit gamma and tau [Mycobacteriales bacterium]